jgi:hypothetical protein
MERASGVRENKKGHATNPLGIWLLRFYLNAQSQTA